MAQAKLYKNARHIGPGGIGCPCCFVHPLSEHKRLNNRKFRNKEQKDVDERAREAEEERRAEFERELEYYSAAWRFEENEY